MVNNLPVITHEHDGLTIEGYSRAAVQSYWRIPELRLGFDLGAQPWSFMGTPNWFISHSHLDHLVALPVYVARRRMMKMEPPVIYLPEKHVDDVNAMLDAFVKLDRGRMPCELVGVMPGDEFELSRELVVTVVPTKHTVPSVGYIVWQRRNKLKTEFSDLSGDEIRDLRNSGTEVSEELRAPLIGYVGDSAPSGLDNNPEFFETKILITEMTFVAPDHRKEKIHKHGHMHLDDIVARKDQFNNECIISSHFSTRYHDQQIKSMVKKALPDMIDGRLKLWL